MTNNAIRGGLVFEPSPFSAIEKAHLPDTVTINIHKDATVVVAPGDKVLTGQPLVKTNSVSSHASLSGVVTRASNRSVTILSDNRDEWYHQSQSRGDVETLFFAMGLVGLGGAAFPVSRKLTSVENKIETLLINAAECDPAIYCDEALMQEHAAGIAAGISIAQKASGAKNCIVGIEENKTAAIAEMQKHLPGDIPLVTVPAIYPSGAEKTLFKLCTGKRGLRENNSICFNVSTCYAMYQAVELSRPLISRVVTIVYENRIANIELRIGTPIHTLEALVGSKIADQVISGGQMMGKLIPKNQFTDKHTNSLILQPPPPPAAKPCIRCGACADVCPEGLYPQQLFWHTEPHNTSALTELNLDLCIECACCDAVCPSHIPLASLFHKASTTIKRHKQDQEKSETAKQRYEKRLARLNTQSTRQQKELDQKSADLENITTSEDAKKALIAKALQRSKNKKSSDNNQDSSQ